MDAQRSGLDAFARPDGVGHTFGETSYFWTFHNPDGGGSPARNGVFALVSEQGKIGHAHLRPQDCFESKSCGRGSTSPIFPAMNGVVQGWPLERKINVSTFGCVYRGVA